MNQQAFVITMNQPHINQIVTLRDGRLVMVYRIEKPSWLQIGFNATGKCKVCLVSVVTATGDKSEVYL